jgi:dihydroorotase
MSITRLPGLIDVHAHLREPGATHKEDFLTGTQAAVKGGFTYVLDMPNNPGAPTISIERLEEKIKLADEKAVCDVGFHYGTDGNNWRTFATAAANARVFGLKIYCNHTTGVLLIEDKKKLEEIFKAWESPKPILVHAEDTKLEVALELAKKHSRVLHECHISLAKEVNLVGQAKADGMMVSAGVTPHHLFLNKNNSDATMRPPLATQDDQDALWQGIKDEVIDLIETDHAPHTPEEKTEGAFGVPGLETAIGLMGLAVHESRITHHDLIKLMHLNPKRIFHIPDQDSFIEVDFDTPYTVDSSKFLSKAKWSPFDGWTLYGNPILRSK